MDDTLRAALRSAGWHSGTLRGFLMTSRAGIEFQVGHSRASGEERLELRYRYRTEQTDTEGTETLPGDAPLSRIEDAMTSIYLRIHERPDYSRVFRSRGASRPPRPTPNNAPPAEPKPTAPLPTQESLDL